MKKALFVCGGWDGHTPRQSAEVFARDLADAGYDVAIRDTLEVYADVDYMKSLDLVVPTVTMSEISKEQWAGLNAAVRGGVGCAGWHGCIIDSFRTNTEYQWMTGGQWVAHPGNGIPRHTVNITDHDHEITRGIPDFDLPDTEQYYCHVDPGNHVLATTTFSGEHGDRDLYPAGTVMPYAWTRKWGAGRVFVAAWGHTFRDFEVPEAHEVVKRGLMWCAK